VLAVDGVSIEKELFVCSVVIVGFGFGFVADVGLVVLIVELPPPLGRMICCSGSSSSSLCEHGVEGGVVFFMAFVLFIMFVLLSFCLRSCL